MEKRAIKTFEIGIDSDPPTGKRCGLNYFVLLESKY